MKQNLIVEKDFYRLRAVLKSWNADKIAQHLISRHKLQGRKTAIIFDDKEVLIYGQRRKPKWKALI